MGKLSLKAQNVAPLAMLTLFFLSVAVAVTSSQIQVETLPSLIPAASGLAITGVVAVFLSYLIPADIKHVIVFARLRDVLPGHRFIALSENDARISNSALEASVSDINDKRKNYSWQNQFWYNEIYRPIRDTSEIASAHKSFLLYRDAASVALLALLMLFFGQLIYEELSSIINHNGLISIGVFVCLFLFAANAAGKRFVTTAVAIHLSPKE